MEEAHIDSYVEQYTIGWMKTTQSKIYVSRSLSDTRTLAEEFVHDLKQDVHHATVFGLSGDLGSGKTSFTKEVAELLGIKKDEVTSPTFVIEKIYTIRHHHFSHLIHIDAYRLENAEELVHLGWNDILKESKNLILIEWPEKVSEVVPGYAQTIKFTFVDETTREIIFP